MPKLSGLIAFGLFYAAIAVGIVHVEAESHRQSIRDRMIAAVEPVAPAVIVEPAVNEPRPVAPPKPEPVIEAKPPVEVVDVRKPEPIPVRPAPRPVVESKGPAASGRDPNAELAKIRAVVVPDLVNLPPAEEARVGQILHGLIVVNHPDDPSNKMLKRVLEAARPLIDGRKRKEIDITVTVLDSDDVNAFSHLGGYIYLTRGMLSFLGTEGEFRFVIGHELAHIDLKHGQQAASEAMAAGAVPGIGTFAYLDHQIAAGYGKAREFEADAWAVDRMRKLENSRRDCLTYLRKLVNYAQEHDFPNGGVRPKTDLSAVVQDVDNHVRAQPAPYERLDKVADRFKTP